MCTYFQQVTQKRRVYASRANPPTKQIYIKPNVAFTTMCRMIRYILSG